MSKLGKWIIIGTTAFVSGLIIISIVLLLNPSQESQTEKTIREDLGGDVNLDEVLFDQDGWRYTKIYMTENPDNIAYAILRTDENDDYQTIMGPGTSFDMWEMTDSGIPAEMQAYILNVSIEDIRQQITDYKNGNNPPPITFAGFETLRSQGLTSSNISAIQAFLNNYSIRQHISDGKPYIRLIRLEPDVVMDGSRTGEFVYRCHLLIDDTDQRRLDIYSSGPEVNPVVLMDVNGNSPITISNQP